MVRTFEVIKVVIHHNRGLFIFARHLGLEHDFAIPDGSVFGDLPIVNYTEMQPLHDKNDEPRPDIFIFRPLPIERLFDKQFKEGQRITLTIPD
jgi:hypothetical protein